MIFARAAFLSALLLLAAGVPTGAQGAWAAVISLMGSAGDVIGKLADGIKKAVDDGYAIGDEAHLHSLQASVLRLEYSITEMTAVQTTMVDRFNHYIQNTDHSPAAWARAKDQLVGVSERVKAVIDAIKASGPDLVRIAGLEHNLDIKTGMLDDMRALPEPGPGQQPRPGSSAEWNFDAVVPQMELCGALTSGQSVPVNCSRTKIPSAGRSGSGMSHSK